jgi:alanine-glyoxylate transaminase/serine-glyoxylate transaminase/serine-pyruvate transaminase
VTIGIGIGDLNGKAIRIAHMGHVNAPMILGTLGSIEMALIALDVPHGNGSGVAAAAERLGRSVPAG